MQRVTRTRAAARAAYNRMSGWYDVLTLGAENKCRHVGLELLDLKPAEAVLEIGVGTGSAIIEMARSVGNSGTVYGIDISDRMIELAQARVDKAGPGANVKLVCADAAVLPCEDDSLDAVFMSFTLELFDTPELDPLLRQCGRKLKKAGRMCVVALSRQGPMSWGVKAYEWAHARFPNSVDCRPIYLESLLQDAGFSIVRKRACSMWGLPVEVVVAARSTA